MTESQLLGVWMFDSIENSAYEVECPDVIRFEPNRHYTVFNDCYGIDPINPVVEQGRWSLDHERMELTLKHRAFTSNYSMNSSAADFELHIESISDILLRVRMAAEDDRVERYTKLKE